MRAVPIELKEANEFVDRLHRHHNSVHRDKFRVGCEINGKLVGVVQLARPVSRMLDNGRTIEVVRLCTDDTPNVCSFLYSRAARIAKEMGYDKIITYILDIELGTSLKASGWHKEADIKGQNWNRPSRPRNTVAPTCNKQRWAKNLNDHGKADITSMKDKTFLEEIDDTDEDDNSPVGKEYVNVACGDSKYGRFSTEMPQRLKKQLEELKKSGNYSMGDVVKLIDNFSENIKDE